MIQLRDFVLAGFHFWDSVWRMQAEKHEPRM
jgi:hypothetical protein